MGTCGRSDGEQEQDVAAISEDWEVRFRVNSDEASRHDHQRDSEDKSEEEMGGVATVRSVTAQWHLCHHKCIRTSELSAMGGNPAPKSNPRRRRGEDVDR